MVKKVSSNYPIFKTFNKNFLKMLKDLYNWDREKFIYYGVNKNIHTPNLWLSARWKQQKLNCLNLKKLKLIVQPFVRLSQQNNTVIEMCLLLWLTSGILLS